MTGKMGEFSVKIDLVANYTPATEQKIKESVHIALTNASVAFRRELEQGLRDQQIAHNVKINQIIS